MGKLTIWHGGVKVYPVENLVASTDPADKFNTCANRSEKEVSEIKRTCCNSTAVIGYKCIKLSIHPLSAERCKECLHYQAKPGAQRAG